MEMESATKAEIMAVHRSGSRAGRGEVREVWQRRTAIYVLMCQISETGQLR
jgi:hypothetical protein